MSEVEDKNVLENSFEALTKAIPQLGGIEGIGAILALPDEQFDLFAPIVLQQTEKALNNPTDRYLLMESLSGVGFDAEEMQKSFDATILEIDNQMTDINQNKRDFIKCMMGILLNTISEINGAAKNIIKIPIELCREDAKIPTYAKLGDAGMDVYACEEIIINPGETVLVPIGIKVALPIGYELQVRPKSGSSLKTKLRVANAPGTIDSGFRDEVCIIIENIEPAIKNINYDIDGLYNYEINSITHGSSYVIEKGQKFAQLVLKEVPTAAFYPVEKVSNIGENRGGGFGSTGDK